MKKERNVNTIIGEDGREGWDIRKKKQLRFDKIETGLLIRIKNKKYNEKTQEIY